MNRIRAAGRIAWLLLLISLLFGMAPAALAATEQQTEDVRKLLEEYHLSGPSDEELNEAAIQGMVDSLRDPYTEYFTDDEWKQFSDYLAQTYVGVGLVNSEDDGTLYVQDVFPNSPAAAAGLQPGDAYVSVNGQSLQDKSLIELSDLLLGEEGSTVKVTVSRAGALRTFTLTRASVQMPIASSTMLGEGVGYLALNLFSADSADKFNQELAKLEKAGLKSLIIDLRDNGGGYVDQAQKIAENFVQHGVLAHLTDRDGNDNPLTLQGQSKPYPVYVLVNENTASASELLSGALQDYGVAKLIGTQTYGKGVVQQIVNVPSGGVLKVTIEEYSTPKGRKVDHKGITPDFVVDGSARQLLTAIRTAGGKPELLVAGRGSLVVDGIRLGQSDMVIRKGSVPYLNVKLAASFLGARLGYDAASRSLSIVIGGKTETLPLTDSHLIVQGGVSSIDVRLLAKWDPQLRWSDANGLLKLAQE